LTLSFSATGVAAHAPPETQKSEAEMIRQVRIDFLNLDSMPPPKTRNLIDSTLEVKTRVLCQNVNKI
jgi:hypothetical protein